MPWYRRFLPLLVIVTALGLVALGWTLLRPGPEFAGTKIEPAKDLSTLRLIATDGTESSFVPPKKHLNLVFFGFTACPDICPTTLSLVRDAKAELGAKGKNIDVTLVTVDPSRDSADVLKKYVEQFISTARGLRTDDDTRLRHVATAFGASYHITMTDTPMSHSDMGHGSPATPTQTATSTATTPKTPAESTTNHGTPSSPPGGDTHVTAAATQEHQEHASQSPSSLVPQVSHTTWLYAINDEGKLVAQWPMGTTKSKLADDLRTLL